MVSALILPSRNNIGLTHLHVSIKEGAGGVTMSPFAKIVGEQYESVLQQSQRSDRVK